MQVPPLETFEEWVAEWKPILGLQAWDISVELVPAKRLSDPRNSAELWSCEQQQTAVIKVANDADADEFNRPDLKDWEESVVHELLHARLDLAAGYTPEPGSLKTTVYEQAISQTAKGFIRVKHARREVRGYGGRG